MRVTERLAVRAPASSANLGAGFDVLAMALGLDLDLGVGPAPADGQAIDPHHPAAKAYIASGGSSDDSLWIRSAIPMGRGLGFSGAARVGGAALGVAIQADEPAAAVELHRGQILTIAAGLEGHGDNAAASVFGGVTAWVDARAVRLRVGPTFAAATVVAWIPGSTTSTERSRETLPGEVARGDVVHNLGRVAQFVVAIEHDAPELLVGATDDRLHQRERLAKVLHGVDALDAGVAAGAWCGWLSGSGPTVAFLTGSDAADTVIRSLPDSGHVKQLGMDPRGVRLLS